MVTEGMFLFISDFYLSACNHPLKVDTTTHLSFSTLSVPPPITRNFPDLLCLRYRFVTFAGIFLVCYTSQFRGTSFFPKILLKRWKESMNICLFLFSIGTILKQTQAAPSSAEGCSFLKHVLDSKLRLCFFNTISTICFTTF